MRGFKQLLTDLELLGLAFELGGPSAAAIVHGGTIAQIMSHLFPSERNFYGWQPPPGLGYILSITLGAGFTYQTIHLPNE
jgi:hypothetical protein